jgi:hypothetical protein
MGAGQPAAAVPLLQERLKISSDRRPLVRQTLADAEAQAGGAAAGATGKKDKPAKPGKRDKD